MSTRYVSAVVATLSSGLLMAAFATAGDAATESTAASAQATQKSPAPQLRDLDSNSDGKLSAQEAGGGGVTQQDFTAADTNHDGSIDAGEYSKWSVTKDSGSK